MGEAARRLKTELFQHMDGIDRSSSADGDSTSVVMVLATTNRPWDLDDAMIRRLEKRIYIPLPDSTARTELFNLNLKDVDCAEDVQSFIPSLVSQTEGYSGADIKLLIREAAMAPTRRLLSSLMLPSSAEATTSVSEEEKKEAIEDTIDEDNVSDTKGDDAVPATVDPNASIRAARDRAGGKLQSPPLEIQDIKAAVQTTKPSVNNDMTAFEKWNQEFGS